MTALGKVFLTGAGPGDPGLLTLKALKVLQEADAVVYDYLANPRLLDLANEKARRLYVGKKSGAHSMNQEEINALLVKLGRQGLAVARLKGGDPFVFGRGGEEALALKRAGIAFEVVPGVTSGVAALAYAGIPLTHRGLAPLAVLATGHESAGSTLDYEALAKVKGTLVIYMGLENAKELSAQLMAKGRSAATPAAVITRGTHPDQKTVITTLGRLALEVRDHGLASPALLVVGEAVSLARELSWFEKRPLSGRRIVVTRALEQSSSLVEPLEKDGADVSLAPALRIRPIRPNRLLERSFRSIPKAGWLLFTSVNAVKIYFGELRRSGRDVRALAGVKVAAIGPATGSALLVEGIRADLQAKEFNAEGLLKALGNGKKWKGVEVVLPRAEKAREVLPEALEKAGARLKIIPLYRTLPAKWDNQDLLEALEAGRVDLVVFTSRSAVENFVRGLKKSGNIGLLRKVKAASLGPVTSQAVRDFGMELAVQARQATLPSLVESIRLMFKSVKTGVRAG